MSDMDDFDIGAFLEDHFRGEGLTHIITGQKGHGKTRLAVTLMQMLITGMYPQCGRFVCMTNILFNYRDRTGNVRVKHPPGVIFVTSMAEILRNTGEILEQYGAGKVSILLILDEAQGYMQAETNMSKENVMMLKFMALTRKFGMTVVFLTPTIVNLAPKIRNLPLHPERPGYCDAHWIKSKSRSKSLVQTSKLNVDPQHLVWLRSAVLMDDEVYRDDPEPLIIKYTSWANVLKEDLNPGQYGYATRSVADFEVGENIHGLPFDFKGFTKAISRCDEDDYAQRIRAFFEEWDGKGGDDADESDDHALAAEVRRAKDCNVIWKDIEYIFGRPASTLRSIMSRYYPNETSQKKVTASNCANCETGGLARAVYIQPGEGETEGDERSISRSVMTQSEVG
ncbi:MAG: ATP-binding protein [Candidatus Methanoplasma sp.]|jgi:hypothetical protein|nr:ATP-binding protein [Candidatus Methanoplasma sp.]